MKKTAVNIAVMLTVLIGWSSLSSAADFTITFRDSTMMEDGHIYSASPLNNYGRAINVSAARVQINSGTNYSNTWTPLFRALAVYDSLGDYSSPIVDSAKLVVKIMDNSSFSATEYHYLQAVGLDADRDWGEGNDQQPALDCEVCWDSCQTIGTGACATAQDWATDGARGAADTLGQWTGKPADSVLVDDGYSWGDSLIIYIDTQVVNIWKDNSNANEGFAVMVTSKAGNQQAFTYFYGSETNLSGAVDSMPYIVIYGHEGGGAQPAPVKKIGAGKPEAGKW